MFTHENIAKFYRKTLRALAIFGTLISAAALAEFETLNFNDLTSIQRSNLLVAFVYGLLPSAIMLVEQVSEIWFKNFQTYKPDHWLVRQPASSISVANAEFGVTMVYLLFISCQVIAAKLSLIGFFISLHAR